MDSTGRTVDDLAEAVNRHRAGRLEDAARHYRAALVADPGNAGIHHALGMVELQAGRPDAAVAHLAQSAALAPDNPDCWLALGTASARARAFASAEAAFARAVALRPDHVASLVNLGITQRRLGRLQEALEAHRRAVGIDPASALARFNLGCTLAESGDRAAAEQALRATLSIDPANVAAMSRLAGLLLESQCLDEALQCYEEVLRTDPSAPRAQYNLGVALQQMGRNSEAVAAFGAELQHCPGDLDAWNNLCISLLRDGRASDALAACDEYLRFTPPYLSKPLAYRAVALLELGRRGEAAALLDFERLLLRRRLAPPQGFHSIEAFNGSLASHVMAAEDLEYEPQAKSTRGGRQSGELFNAADPAIAALVAAIGKAVRDYSADLRGALPLHPYVRRLPSRWRLTGWAVVLDSLGHQQPHFHPDGSISGVYYVRLPPSMRASRDDAGCLEFGRVAGAIGGHAEPLLATVRPEEGELLLFPSYFYHRTIPFEDPEPRISIAFDVMPVG